MDSDGIDSYSCLVSGLIFFASSKGMDGGKSFDGMGMDGGNSFVGMGNGSGMGDGGSDS